MTNSTSSDSSSRNAEARSIKRAPDNKGLLKQKPKNASQAAAEVNRDINGLKEQLPETGRIDKRG